MDPFDPLPAPQITRAALADLNSDTDIMVVFPISALNPVGALRLSNIGDLVSQFALPGNDGTNGISITGLNATEVDGVLTFSFTRDQGEAPLTFTTSDLRGTDGLDGLSIISVTSVDNGDGTLTLSWGRSQGAMDLVFTTPDLRGDDGLDGVSITNSSATTNPDGSTTVTLERDNGAEPDLSFDLPDFTGPPGDDGVGVAGIASRDDQGNLVLDVTLTDGSVINVATDLFIPQYFSDYFPDRIQYPSATNTTQVVRNTINLPALPPGEYVVTASWKQAVSATNADVQTRLMRDGVLFGELTNEESQDPSIGGVAGQLLPRINRLPFTVPPGGQGPETWTFVVNRRLGAAGATIEFSDTFLTIERKL